MKRNNGRRNNRYVADMGCYYGYGPSVPALYLGGRCWKAKKMNDTCWVWSGITGEYAECEFI